MPSRPDRRCTSCGKSVDDLPYEFWLFHSCRSCVAETRTREWYRDYGGSQRKWAYRPQWHRDQRSEQQTNNRENYDYV